MGAFPERCGEILWTLAISGARVEISNAGNRQSRGDLGKRHRHYGERGADVVDMKFKVTVLPVAGAERAKAFYRGLGWRLGDPQGGTYRSFATFADPDGNSWLLQEITQRLPGRVWPTDIGALAALLHETADHHGAFEAVAPKHDWWD